MERCQRCDGQGREITEKEQTIEGQTQGWLGKMGKESYSEWEVCVISGRGQVHKD